MLEILAVIFLTKKIGELAEQKGQAKGKWKAFTVIGWFGSEIAGIVIGFSMFGENALGPVFLLAYTLAILSYFAIRQALQKMPDVDTDFDFEKEPPQS